MHRSSLLLIAADVFEQLEQEVGVGDGDFALTDRVLSLVALFAFRRVFLGRRHGANL